jgi:hypothetical protein
MSVLERIYSLEVEFHRRFRLNAPPTAEPWSVHTSYALQHNYEPMLRTVGAVDHGALTQAKERMLASGDPRDVEAAFRSLRHLLASN